MPAWREWPERHHSPETVDMTETVLVVDDDDTVRSYLAEALREEGFEAAERDSADGLADSVRLHPPHAIVLDYLFPDGPDGLAALRELRARRLTVPVVMLTSEPDQSLAVDCFAAGATDFIFKPVEPDYLAIVVRRAIDHHAGSLKDALFRLLPYVHHHQGCVPRSDGSCSCGLVDAMERVGGVTRELFPPQNEGR
jgi:two-component system C4-dicarboxylate transport response regulator DctD